MAKAHGDNGALKDATRVTRIGRDPDLTGPFVNPPVVHASTVLFESAEGMANPVQKYRYGRRGTPTTEALETAITELENAEGTVLCPSGLSAISTALLSCLNSGDQVLMVDTNYDPARYFADRVLARMGIETVYYDPAIGADIEHLFTERTRAVYLESPGSLDFQMQDTPAIAEVAKRHNALTIFDNTWATPLRFKPLDHGADLVIEAGTKFFGGHSDVSIGTVSATGKSWLDLRRTHGALGLHVAPDDVFLTLRGLRTLAIRLDRQTQSAVTIATWLADRPEVTRIMFPALESDPGHGLWSRDMPGAGSLFSFILGDWSIERIGRFVDALGLFGIGASWAGFESLVLIANPSRYRSATAWEDGPLVRFSIGLEDTGDLINDIGAAFEKAAD
jgi:cystathionine beta-lyase